MVEHEFEIDKHNSLNIYKNKKVVKIAEKAEHNTYIYYPETLIE